MTPTALRGLLVAATLIAAGTAHAADPALGAFPDSAGLVIRLKNPEGTVRKIGTFARAADPRAGQTAAQLNAMLGIPISNPTLAGVDAKADWWLAVFPKADGAPGVVFAVPATNIGQMKEAVGGRFTFVEQKQRVFYSEDSSALELVQRHLGGGGGSVAAAVDDRSQAVFDAGDLSVFINVPRLRIVYSEQLSAAREELQRTLEEFANLTPAVPGVDLKPVFELYGQVLEGLLQAVDDASGCTMAVAVTARHVTLEQYLSLTADSPTDKYLQTHAPAPMALLDKLPANKLAYFGFHGDTRSLTEWGMKFARSMLPADSDQLAEFDRLLAELKEIEFGSYLMALGLGKLDGGALRLGYAVEAKPAEKMRSHFKQMTAVMSATNVSGVKQHIDLKVAAEEYGPRKADLITITQEFGPEVDPQIAQMQAKMMEILYGPDGMTTRMVYLPDLVVQTMGGGRVTMEEMLASLTAADGVRTTRPAHQVTRGLLQEKCNVLVLVDAAGLVAEGARMIVENGQLPIPIDVQTLQDLKLARSYLGWSLATEPGGLRAKTIVPVSQVQGFIKIGGAFQQMQSKPQL